VPKKQQWRARRQHWRKCARLPITKKRTKSTSTDKIRGFQDGPRN